MHERASQQARAEQHTLALLTLVVARNPYVGGMKDLELDDLFTGLARATVTAAPYSAAVMRGIETAVGLEARLGRLVLSQAHVDLLGGKDLARYWRNTRGSRAGASREALSALRGLKRKR